MAPYATKQRKILLDYLSANADKQLTADRIYDALTGAGMLENISKSAVYRNLAALEQDEKIHRSTHEGSRKIYYQYTGATKCKGELHLACKKCGKTIHLDKNTAETLVENVAGIQNFIIDKNETVLYGTCDNCAHAKERDCK